MIRRFFIVALMVMVAFVANAQKRVMYAGSFTYADNIPVSSVIEVRTAIVSGIIDTQRFDLIDADSEDQLNTEAERRASEEAMADKAARTSAMQDKAAELLLYGYIAQCESMKSDTEGGFKYNAEVKFTVKVVQASDKKVVASKDFNLSGLKMGGGDTPEAAIADALRHVKNDMKNFVDENFKLKAVVLGEGYEVKRNKEIVSCLITLGTDHGVEKGQRLDVSVVNIIAGRETNKVIGQLAIQEVLAGDLSQCKVTKGGEEIFKAMNDYLKVKDEDPEHARELQVVTKKQSGMKNLLKQGGAMFGL